jgi:hypothetical protein
VIERYQMPSVVIWGVFSVGPGTELLAFAQIGIARIFFVFFAILIPRVLPKRILKSTDSSFVAIKPKSKAFVINLPFPRPYDAGHQEQKDESEGVRFYFDAGYWKISLKCPASVGAGAVANPSFIPKFGGLIYLIENRQNRPM